MTWLWLFVWNAYWLIFALLYVSLESKLGGDLPQGRPGRTLEHRGVKRPCNRRVRAPRLHRR
jgi:hypothetical protein